MRERLGDSPLGVVGTDPLALAAGLGLLLVAAASVTATPVTYAGAVAVAAVTALGPVAAVGGAIGLVVHDLFRGALGRWTVVVAAWIVAFGWSLAWLVPHLARGGPAPHSRVRAATAFAGAALVAGTLSTALAAWLAALLDVQRFYTAAASLVPGVPVAAGVGALGLVLGAGRIGRAVRAGHEGGRSGGAASDPGPADRRPRRRRTPDRWTSLALAALGAAWLGGAGALDVLVHDLRLFETEIALLYYAEGILGGDSAVATAGRAVLLGIYRYGELAVLLSAPLAAVALALLYARGRRESRTRNESTELAEAD